MNIDDRVLCPVTDFEEFRPSKGRGYGQVFNRRLVVAADKYNWVISYDYEGSGLSGNDRSFHPSFKLVFAKLVNDHGLTHAQIQELAAQVFIRLNKLMGKDIEADVTGDVRDIGSRIDQVFHVNFCLHDNVLGRVFRGEVEAEVAPRGKVPKPVLSVEEIFRRHEAAVA